MSPTQQHHQDQESPPLGQPMEGGVGRGREENITHARSAFTAAENNARVDVQPADNNTHHNNTTTNNNYWQPQRQRQRQRRNQQHEEEEEAVLNSIIMRRDSFLEGMERFPTPVATNTNYNNIPNNIGGGVNNTAAAGDSSVHNETNNNNLMMMMDRRDSLLGLAGRIHPPSRQDNGMMNFNNRRGSMGSLSGGIAGPGVDVDDVGGRRTSEHSNDRNNSNNHNAGIHNNINNNTNYWNQNDRNSTATNRTNNSNSNNSTNSNTTTIHADEHARINYLAARAHAAQMIAVEESKRLEENLMRLEMRRVMMTKERQQRQQQQRLQQQQQEEQQGGQQHQQQDGGRHNSQDNGQTHCPPLTLPHVNNTNYNTMNMANTPVTATATAPNVAQATTMTRRQSNNEDQTLMALAQQQFNNQGQFHNNHHHNRMMNHNNPTQMQGNNNNINTNNMHGYLQASATAQNDNGARSATMPQHNIHNAYQQQQQQQKQTQAQSQEQPPSTVIPNTPRRPLSAYNIFFSEIRSELLKEADDENDIQEEEDKKNNEDKKTQEQESTTGELQEAQVDDDDLVTTTTTTDKNKQFKSFADNLAKTRLNKDPKKRAHRKTHGKVAFVSLAKMVGQKWRALPDEKKKKYQDLALADKERYRKEKMAVANAMREEVKRWKKDENDRVFLKM